MADLQTDVFKTAKRLEKKQMEEVLKHVSDVYYNDGISLLTDETFDRLKELYVQKFGDNPILHTVGAVVTKEKVKLPFYMGSMDKIKPDRNNLESWKRKYSGKVCLSDKLDGISSLFLKRDGKMALYTRGDGTIGQDISHMIPYIQIGDIPAISTFAVRGELIVSKANYAKVQEGKKGARQMVSGLANQKTLTADRIKLMQLVEFVAYECIVPESLMPSDQFRMLDAKSTFQVAWWESVEELTIASLSETLSKRKSASKYEIDGIIVAHDRVYPRVQGRNPEHAFAFKMSFADQTAITEVLDVHWEASKDGYLKPTVQFEPVNIGGSTIQYATGFHAGFVHQHGIGPGAFVEIIRSGDVIPYIREVKSAAPAGPAMPSEPWHWNESHVDAILNAISGNPDVRKRTLLYFAQRLEIGSCGEGTIAKLYDAGIHTIPAFLEMTKEFLTTKVAGFGTTSAEKLLQNIEEAKKKATVVQWAVGSGIFGRGIGSKRLESAFQLSKHDITKIRAEDVAKLTAWSKDSATEFVGHISEFQTFLDKVGVSPKQLATPPGIATRGKFLNVVVLFTGFHPKDLEDAVQSQGATLADAFSKKVTMLVIKDDSVSNEKTKKATANGIPVVTADQLVAMLHS